MEVQQKKEKEHSKIAGVEVATTRDVARKTDQKA